MTRVREEINAQTPRPTSAGTSGCRPGCPSSMCCTPASTRTGSPHEPTRFVMPADMIGLPYDVPVE
jgi:GntR family transcriptional regulator